LNSFGEYFAYLDRTPRAFEEMISRITTHFTGFFREPIQFEILRQSLLPQLIRERMARKRLRIWSAACSSGEEIYTILIELLDFFGGEIPPNWDVKILGTDIDQRSLAAASQGVFAAETLKTLPDPRMNRYFVEEGARVRFNPRLATPLRFAQLNLMAKAYPFKEKMDIIFCRNVAIYFDSDGKDHLYQALHRHLAEDGYLFSGHSESLLRYPHLYKHIKRSIYQRKHDQTV
jgi:chemotaxis protein methyltransferase CheR